MPERFVNVDDPAVLGSGDAGCGAQSVSFESSASKSDVLAALRDRIAAMQDHKSMGPLQSSLDARSGWNLGCSYFDTALPRGLQTNALHEIKGHSLLETGASAADWMAAIGFTLRLAVRRLRALEIVAANQKPWVIWCWPRVFANEFGRPSGAGFASLGIDPSRLLVVETARSAETLNAIEECLKASSAALVIGVLNEVDLTPGRRLSLAAGLGATPCLLVSHPTREPASVAATRWRIATAPSAAHPFDPRAPGRRRFSVALERCRSQSSSFQLQPQLLEWSDETHCFGLASVLANGTPQAHLSKIGAGL